MNSLIQDEKNNTIVDYLYSNNIVAFLVMVLAIITAQFWFSFFKKLFVADEHSSASYLFFITLVFTIIFIGISMGLFKIPIAASYSL